MAVYSVEQIKERIIPVAQRYGVKRVMLFGSYARGEAAEDSDVDLHVWRGNIRGLFALSGFRLDLADALGKEVDLVTHGGMRKKFYERIKDDEVQVYGEAWQGRRIAEAHTEILRPDAARQGAFWRVF
jgi:predicted nucleotidyltransferase